MDYTLGNEDTFVILNRSVCIPLHVIKNQVINVEDRTFKLKLSTSVLSRDIIVYQQLLNVTLRDVSDGKLHF